MQNYTPYLKFPLVLYPRWGNDQQQFHHAERMVKQGKIGHLGYFQWSSIAGCRWSCNPTQHLILLHSGGTDVPSSVSWKSPSQSWLSCRLALIYTSEAVRTPPTAEASDVGRGNKWWRYQSEACLIPKLWLNCSGLLFACFIYHDEKLWLHLRCFKMTLTLMLKVMTFKASVFSQCFNVYGETEILTSAIDTCASPPLLFKNISQKMHKMGKGSAPLINF